MAFLLSLALSALAFAAPTLSRDPGPPVSLTTPDGIWPSRQLRNPQPLEEEMNLEKLLTLIRDRGVTSIEALLPLLPFQMRDSNYVVMYRSRSLQAASPTAPRIISFTPTARFILSYNGGEPAQRGHDTLEIIQFRTPEARFEFREITFDGRSAPKVSEANPKKCVECHQASSRKGLDLRPNWEPYNAWPGAIGSADGKIGGPGFSFVRDGRGQPQDEAAIREQTEEGSMAKAFLQLAAEHPRYRHLETLVPHVTSELSDRLAALNFPRVLRLIRENEKVFEANREVIGAIALCPGYGLERVLKPYEVRSPWRYSKLEMNHAGAGFSKSLTWLYEGLGIDTSDWTMDFGSRGRFAAFERFGTPSVTVDFYKWAWERSEPEAARFKAMGCQELLKQADSKLNAYLHAGAPGSPGPETLRPKAEASGILNRCARCHTGAAPIGPAVPFNDGGALRSALDRATRSGRMLFDEILYRTSDMATREEQMPPAERLSPEEAQALKEYFQKLRGL